MSGAHTHYWLCGGRGSTKSSFVSIEIILGIMKNPGTCAVALRKVGATIKDSIYAQLLWAIDMLGASDKWSAKLSPLELIYEETGQKILFRGADDPQKIKSTKVAQGYIRYIWYEELAEFGGMEEIRSINQSLMRGGEKFDVFYSYNPPISVQSWVNIEAQLERDDRLVHHSTYLDVPVKWLGEVFFQEANHLKKTHPRLYEHEYMGVPTGSGGEVFECVTLREISDEEINGFDSIRRGIDFGYAADPFVYVICNYDSHRRRLYIFGEIYKRGLSNRRAAEMINDMGGFDVSVICDSAEPKSINELREYGINAVGAKKGPDSVSYGIKFLQSLDEIVIDPSRCPETAREFTSYELERGSDGEFREGYPDKNNHSIDAVRYALERDSSRKRARVIERGKMNL
jgi:phage terminase large subunit|nr:MAG TPA: terminase large subunit [Caudoviricetes sp.]